MYASCLHCQSHSNWWCFPPIPLQQRMMSKSTYFMMKDTPEKIFITELARLKQLRLHAALAAPGGAVAERLKRDLTVRVCLTRRPIRAEECSPPTWRRVRVSAGITLNALADKARFNFFRFSCSSVIRFGRLWTAQLARLGGSERLRGLKAGGGAARSSELYALRSVQHAAAPLISIGVFLPHLSAQVLAPVMGWCRNYHAYIFTDRTDGALQIRCGQNCSDRTEAQLGIGRRKQPPPTRCSCSGCPYPQAPSSVLGTAVRST